MAVRNKFYCFVRLFQMFKFNFGEKHDEPSEAAATAKPGQKDKRQRAEAKEHFMSEAHMVRLDTEWAMRCILA